MHLILYLSTFLFWEDRFVLIYILDFVMVYILV